jgi:hypothetical protein
MPMRNESTEFTDEGIHRLLREIEGQSPPPPPEARIKRPQSYSATSITRELTVDELLQKIQRDIKNE